MSKEHYHNVSDEFLESPVLLQALIDTAIDGIIMINIQGRIELANPAAATLFQYEASELIGQKINMLMPEPHHSQHDAYMQRYYQTGHKKIIGIGRVVNGQKKDGTLFPLRLSVSEIKINGHTFFTGLLHDLTEQHKAAQAIRQLNQQLEKRVHQRTSELQETVGQLKASNQQLAGEIHEREKIEALLRETEKEIRSALEKEQELNEMKSRFVTMASHEFRTPLSTILSSTDLIELHHNNGTNKVERHLQRIRSSVGNLTNILEDFLSLSQIEEGKLQVNATPFDLAEFCEEVVGEVSGLLRQSQIIHHRPCESQTVVLDKQLLKNICINLLSNAIKYSPQGTDIHCAVAVIEDHLIIEVRDEGIGIPDADQSHLFTRFFRAGNATNIQGTGLGLNIVKKYVDLLKGSIDFKSKLDRGSTFVVRVPLSH
ncbi:MAG: PAS domain-containing sensor histidine kinase [Bacteroidota bacterium]